MNEWLDRWMNNFFHSPKSMPALNYVKGNMSELNSLPLVHFFALGRQKKLLSRQDPVCLLWQNTYPPPPTYTLVALLILFHLQMNRGGGGCQSLCRCTLLEDVLGNWLCSRQHHRIQSRGGPQGCTMCLLVFMDCCVVGSCFWAHCFFLPGLHVAPFAWCGWSRLWVYSSRSRCLTTSSFLCVVYLPLYLTQLPPQPLAMIWKVCLRLSEKCIRRVTKYRHILKTGDS